MLEQCVAEWMLLAVGPPRLDSLAVELEGLQQEFRSGSSLGASSHVKHGLAVMHSILVAGGRKPNAA